MSILYATTRIQLLSPGEDDTEAEDWGGAPAPDTGYSEIGSPVRAHLSAPAGAASVGQGGSISAVFFRLLCDPCSLTSDMQVRDVNTGVVYQVQWTLQRPEPMNHVVAGLSQVSSSA